jgi:YVTN family beta-propeller protein
VALRGEDAVAVIDVAAGAVVGRVAVGASPSALAVSPDGSALFVVNGGDDTLSVISTTSNRVTRTIAVGTAPSAIAILRVPGGCLAAPPPASPSPSPSGTRTPSHEDDGCAVAAPQHNGYLVLLPLALLVIRRRRPR